MRSRADGRRQMKLFRDKNLTPDWNVDLPDPGASRREPAAPLGDPPFPGSSEKAIAAAKPQPPLAGPEIILDRPWPAIRLNTRGQM